jgi:hypothetical protein
MRNRCNNPNFHQYHDYGGRGIRICARWDDFEMFAADVGDPPSKEYTIDRIDNDLGYCPENVRWADRSTQNKNQRRWKK